MGVSFFPALSSFFSNFHKPFPDYLWQQTSSDQAETDRSQAQSGQTEGGTVSGPDSPVSRPDSRVSRPDSPTHTGSFKRGWPRKYSSCSSCESDAADEGGNVEPIRILPRINSEEFWEEDVDECTHAASSLQDMLPPDRYYDRYRDENYDSCRKKQADQVLLHSAICSPKDLASAHGGIAVALASETVDVEGKPVEIYNVAQPDSSGPAAAGWAVQAGDYERQQRDFSHSCT
jgi:hypothetical protein